MGAPIPEPMPEPAPTPTPIAFDATEHDGHYVYGRETVPYAGAMYANEHGWHVSHNRSDDEGSGTVTLDGCHTCNVTFIDDEDDEEGT